MPWKVRIAVGMTCVPTDETPHSGDENFPEILPDLRRTVCAANLFLNI